MANVIEAHFKALVSADRDQRGEEELERRIEGTELKNQGVVTKLEGAR